MLYYASSHLLTRESVLRQGVQPASDDSCLPFSICGPSREASQCVLRLGRALVPLDQRRVRLQRGHFTNGGAEVGGGKLWRRCGKARGVRRPETHCCVREVGGDSTLDWTLEQETGQRLELLHSPQQQIAPQLFFSSHVIYFSAFHLTTNKQKWCTIG